MDDHQSTPCLLDCFVRYINIYLHFNRLLHYHYSDVIMGMMASQITSLTIVYFKRLFRHRWKKTSRLCITGLCAGNSPVTGEFHAQMASNMEDASIIEMGTSSPSKVDLNSLFCYTGSGNGLLLDGNQAIPSANVDFSSVRSCGIYLRTLS